MKRFGWRHGLAARVLAALLLCALFVVPSYGVLRSSERPPPTASEIHIEEIDGRTRFSIAVTRAVSFNVHVLPDPYRAIVDLPELVFQLPRDSGKTGAGLVTAYRFGRIDEGRSRIVMDARGPVLIERSFVEPARADLPARLVIELVGTDAATYARLNGGERPAAEPAEDEQAAVALEQPIAEQAVEEAPAERAAAARVPVPLPKPDRTRSAPKPKLVAQPRKAGKRVVVIDPGHGGVDPGAIGLGGTAEKEVVLAFARALKAALERSKRYTVVLTRDKDVFLTLRERVKVARDHNADLLIALHADSLKRAGTRGATVYTLSDRASDAEAEALAQKENRSDIIGGVDLGAETEEVTGILIDLAQRETRTHSTVFAKHLAKELKGVTQLTGRPIRSAGFRVLKAPDVPSVLLELGYLSSRADEQLLNSGDWRAKVSKSVAAAIDQYFATQLAAGQ